MKGRIVKPEARKPKLILPRVGKLKVGYKTTKGFPVSVDYFIPVGKYAGLFTSAYGEKPQTVQIIFPDDDPERVCCEQYEYRNDAGQRIAYGDGAIFHVWNGKEYMELSISQYPNLMESISKKYPNKKVLAGGDGWDVTIILNFIIPLVRGVAGVWSYESKGSLSTIPAIRDTFDTILSEKGFVKGILFDLNVQFVKTQKPGDKSKFPVVSLVPNMSEENVLKIGEALKGIFTGKLLKE